MAMASSLFAQFAFHLSDGAFSTITSSSRQSSSSSQMRSQAQALSILTDAALVAYETASRLGLGLPERILIENQSPSPIILHSYLHPSSIPRPRSRPVQSRASGNDVAAETRMGQMGMRSVHESADIVHADQHGHHEGLVNGVNDGETGAAEMGNEVLHQPSLLIATVVAPTSADGSGARRLAARRERTGRAVQRQWVKEQEQLGHSGQVLADEDG